MSSRKTWLTNQALGRGLDIYPESQWAARESARENNMMNEGTRKGIIDESRAAFLLGLPKEKLREICEMSGFGHLEPGEPVGELMFTYEELHKLCQLIVGPGA